MNKRRADTSQKKSVQLKSNLSENKKPSSSSQSKAKRLSSFSKIVQNHHDYQIPKSQYLRYSFYRESYHCIKFHKTAFILKFVTCLIAFILSFSSTSTTLWGLQTVGEMNINQTSYIDMGKNVQRPIIDPEAGNALNILLIGVDSRDGEANQAIGGSNEDEIGLHNSDTTILMHISSDRKRIDAISIPRDSIIDSPECILGQNKSISAKSQVMFNSVFANAWAISQDDYSAGQCVQKTVEEIAKVRIDYLMIADFAGFENMVNALNGVDMCIPEAIDSPEAGGLKLPEGINHLDGYQAINYARARKGIGLGDGSDLGRIQRQQRLVGSIMKSALSKNFTNINSLTSFITASSKSLKMTMPANIAVGLAWSLKNIHLSNIIFVMIPVEEYYYDHNRVQFAQSAETIWSQIRKDRNVISSDADNDDEPEINDNKEIGLQTDEATGTNYRSAFGSDTCIGLGNQN